NRPSCLVALYPALHDPSSTLTHLGRPTLATGVRSGDGMEIYSILTRQVIWLCAHQALFPLLDQKVGDGEVPANLTFPLAAAYRFAGSWRSPRPFGVPSRD